jgi:hypothetical protein
MAIGGQSFGHVSAEATRRSLLCRQ